MYFCPTKSSPCMTYRHLTFVTPQQQQSGTKSADRKYLRHVVMLTPSRDTVVTLDVDQILSNL